MEIKTHDRKRRVKVACNNDKGKEIDKLLTWDQIRVEGSKPDVRSIRFVVEAGDIAYLEVEYYGLPDDPNDIGGEVILKHEGTIGGGPVTHIKEYLVGKCHIDMSGYEILNRKKEKENGQNTSS